MNGEKKILVRDCRKQGGTLNVRFKDDEGGLDFFSILPESAEEYYRNMDPEVFAKLLVFDLIGDSANDEYIEKNWVFKIMHIPCKYLVVNNFEPLFSAFWTICGKLFVKIKQTSNFRRRSGFTRQF